MQSKVFVSGSPCPPLAFRPPLHPPSNCTAVFFSKTRQKKKTTDEEKLSRCHLPFGNAAYWNKAASSNWSNRLELLFFFFLSIFKLTLVILWRALFHTVPRWVIGKCASTCSEMGKMSFLKDPIKWIQSFCSDIILRLLIIIGTTCKDWELCSTGLTYEDALLDHFSVPVFWGRVWLTQYPVTQLGVFSRFTAALLERNLSAFIRSSKAVVMSS